MKPNCKNLQISFDSLELKPWNHNRFLRTSSYLKKSLNTSDIFSLSEGRSENPRASLHPRRTARKPKTAPSLKKKQPLGMHTQLTNLGVVTQQDIAKEQFEERLDNIHLHQNFRASLQQKKQLMFLKPQMKNLNKYLRRSKQVSNATQGLEKLKTELYKSLGDSEICPTIQSQSILGARGDSCKRYLTEYQGEKIASARSEPFHKFGALVKSQRTRHPPISVMREKIRNRYRLSKP